MSILSPRLNPLSRSPNAKADEYLYGKEEDQSRVIYYIEFFQCPVDFLGAEPHSILILILCDCSFVETSNGALGELW